jgi:hypothetical protein
MTGEIMQTHLEMRIARLEKKNRALTVLVFALGILMAGSGLLLAFHTGGISRALRLKDLAIVDDSGKVRMRLAASLPDPVIAGKKVPREGSVSGILLYDSDGDERGGYVVDNAGNALLSLDSKHDQLITLVAYPGGESQLAINTNNRAFQLALSAAHEGPSIKLYKNGNDVLFHIP